MNYKPEVQTGNDPKFYGNALVFATREEGEASAKDLFNRWTLCVDHRAVESDEPVNSALVDGKMTFIAVAAAVA